MRVRPAFPNARRSSASSSNKVAEQLLFGRKQPADGRPAHAFGSNLKVCLETPDIFARNELSRRSHRRSSRRGDSLPYSDARYLTVSRGKWFLVCVGSEGRLPALGKLTHCVIASAAPRLGMALYQMLTFYFSSGHFVRAREFKAETDAAAIAYAENARGLARTELWKGDRKIKQWDAFPPLQ